jgi:hypothetical protein
LSRRGGDTALAVDGVEHDEEVEVDPAELHRKFLLDSLTSRDGVDLGDDARADPRIGPGAPPLPRILA